MHELCEFHLHFTSLNTQVLELTNGDLVAINAQEIHVLCANKQPQIFSPDQIISILTPPCMCDIYVADKWIPARMQNCKVSSNPATLKFSVNLPLMMEVFDPKLIKETKLTGDKYFDNRPNIPFPNFTLPDEVSQEIHMGQREDHIPLSVAVERLRHLKPIVPFSRRSRDINPNAFIWNNNTINWPFILTILALVATVVLTGILVIFRKKWLSWATLLAHLVPKVEAQKQAQDPFAAFRDPVQQYLNQDPHTLAEASTSNQPETLPFHILASFANSLLILICICLVIYWLRRCWYESKIILSLVLTSLEESVEIPMQSLPLPLLNMHFSSDDPFDQLKLSGVWYRSVLSWESDLLIKDRKSKMVLVLNRSVRIPLLKCQKVLNIVKQHYAVALRLSHQGHSTFISHLCKEACQMDRCPIGYNLANLVPVCWENKQLDPPIMIQSGAYSVASQREKTKDTEYA